MTISLPDVNTWIALAAAGHVHHQRAREWFTMQGRDSVAFCRITQMGLLRLLTNASVMAGAPFAISEAWDLFSDLRRDPRVIFAPEPACLEPAWRALMHQRGVGPRSWTDAYLAAFARAHGYLLVTFDAGFKLWTGLNLELLSVQR